MSARMCLTAWNDPMGRSNCRRSFAYETERSVQALARPTRNAADTTPPSRRHRAPPRGAGVGRAPLCTGGGRAGRGGGGGGVGGGGGGTAACALARRYRAHRVVVDDQQGVEHVEMLDHPRGPTVGHLEATGHPV